MAINTTLVTGNFTVKSYTGYAEEINNMTNDQKYDLMDGYLLSFTDRYFIRTYSDGNMSVSLTVDNKTVALDGDYDTILTCVKRLKEIKVGI